MDLLSINELPPHDDFGDPCTHVEAYRAVREHTKGTVFDGPSTFEYCVQCSESIQEWVGWPCPRMER